MLELDFLAFFLVQVTPDKIVEKHFSSCLVWHRLFCKITFLFLDKISTQNGKKKKLLDNHSSL
jgi:hypothetical protein